MPPKKKIHPKIKPILHPRSKHRERYDFKVLIADCPELAPFVSLNKYGDESIDFFNPEAVKALNKALLDHFYDIEHWEVPVNYLCPPIPGRADYVHYVADLLAGKNGGKIPHGEKIKALDIGVGASCIYPIIGFKEYGWSFIGSDIDPVAIESAAIIIESNPALQGMIELRLQKNPKDIFRGILQENERIDLTLCNPPFHASSEEAQANNLRKLSKLKGKRVRRPSLNFGGQNTELWCEGGEKQFSQDMILQSKDFATSCFWFTTLVSKEVHLKGAYEILKQVEAVEVRTIPMGQGNKTSRILAWTFLRPKQQKVWTDTLWESL